MGGEASPIQRQCVQRDVKPDLSEMYIEKVKKLAKSEREA